MEYHKIVMKLIGTCRNTFFYYCTKKKKKSDIKIGTFTIQMCILHITKVIPNLWYQSKL